MSQHLIDYLDIDLAWRRAIADERGRVFVRHPYERKLIEVELHGWLSVLKARLGDGRYGPAASVVVDIPKAGSTVRPGGSLTLEDRIVYAACVGACLPMIREALAWAEGKVDFSYQLASDPQAGDWVKSYFPGWKAFSDEGLKRISEGTSCVVFSDISAYYENIDIGLLVSDLRSIGCPDLVVDQLSVCLNRWASHSRGILQGHTASDILDRLYLNSLDQKLVDCGYCHVRYVDDYRLFCSLTRHSPGTFGL